MILRGVKLWEITHERWNLFGFNSDQSMSWYRPCTVVPPSRVWQFVSYLSVFFRNPSSIMFSCSRMSDLEWLYACIVVWFYKIAWRLKLFPKRRKKMKYVDINKMDLTFFSIIKWTLLIILMILYSWLFVQNIKKKIMQRNT